jgi:hypothetical protein
MKTPVIVLALSLSLILPGMRAEDPATRPGTADSGYLLAIRSDFAPVFNAVLTSLKAAGETIAYADPIEGVIATAVQTEGGFRQTGVRLVIQVSPGNYQLTFVEVMVTVQQRFNPPQWKAEPWGNPTLDRGRSRQAVGLLRRQLGFE